MKVADLSVYLVLDRERCPAHSMVETACRAVTGGASMVQLRDKIGTTADLIAVGRQLKAALAKHAVPLVVNDNLEAALAIDANGIHVGQDDISPPEARGRLGAEKIVGLSVEAADAMTEVDPSVVDYVGIGPVFATTTKPDHKPPIGLDGLRTLVALSPVPAVAIGGLKLKHAAAVLQSGAQGMAVISAICGQLDPEAATRGIKDAIIRCRARFETREMISKMTRQG